MFENLNWWEIVVILLVAVFIFGPERLPKLIGDAARWIRKLRTMARNATGDLSRELGTDVKLEDLHPKTFVRKHLLSEEDEAYLRRPFEDVYKDLKDVTATVNDHVAPLQEPFLPAASYVPPSAVPQPSNGATNGATTGPTTARAAEHRYDDVT